MASEENQQDPNILKAKGPVYGGPLTAKGEEEARLKKKEEEEPSALEHWISRLSRGIIHAGAAVTDQSQGTTFYQSILDREGAANKHRAEKEKLAAAQEFAKSERIAGQEFDTAAAAERREHEIAVLGAKADIDIATREDVQEHERGIQESGFTQQSAENQLSRDHAVSMFHENADLQKILQDRGFVFQAGEAQSERELKSLLAKMREEHDVRMLDKNHVWTDEQRVLQNVFTTSERVGKEAHASLLQQKAQAEQTKLAQMQQEHQKDMQSTGIVAQSEDTQVRLDHAAAQAALDRDLQKDQMAADKADENRKTASAGIGAAIQALSTNIGTAGTTMSTAQAQGFMNQMDSIAKNIADNSYLEQSDRDALTSALSTARPLVESVVATQVINNQAEPSLSPSEMADNWRSMTPEQREKARGTTNWSNFLTVGNATLEKYNALPRGAGGQILSGKDNAHSFTQIGAALENATSFEELLLQGDKGEAALLLGLDLEAAKVEGDRQSYIGGELQIGKEQTLNLYNQMPPTIREMIEGPGINLPGGFSLTQPSPTSLIEGAFDPSDLVISGEQWAHPAIEGQGATVRVELDRRFKSALSQVTDVDELFDLNEQMEQYQAMFPLSEAPAQVREQIYKRTATMSDAERAELMRRESDKPQDSLTALVTEFEKLRRNVLTGEVDPSVALSAAQVEVLVSELEEFTRYPLHKRDELIATIAGFKTREDQLEFLSEHKPSPASRIAQHRMGHVVSPRAIFGPPESTATQMLNQHPWVDRRNGENTRWRTYEPGTSDKATRTVPVHESFENMMTGYYDYGMAPGMLGTLGGALGWVGAKGMDFFGVEPDVTRSLPIEDINQDGYRVRSPQELADRLHSAVHNFDHAENIQDDVSFDGAADAFRKQWSKENEGELLATSIEADKQMLKQYREHGMSQQDLKSIQDRIDYNAALVDGLTGNFRPQFLTFVENTFLVGEDKDFAGNVVDAIKGLAGTAGDLSTPGAIEQALAPLGTDATTIQRLGAIREGFTQQQQKLGQQSAVPAAKRDTMVIAIDNYIELYKQVKEADPDAKMLEAFGLEPANQQDPHVAILQFLLGR